MMKPFALIATVLFLSSCHSNGSNTASKDTSNMNTQEVQNVNGNIPDTSNSISITGGPHSRDTDSTYIDTARKKPR